MKFQLFEEFPRLMADLSKIADGSMKFANDPQKNAQISNNRELFLKSIGVASDRLVSAQLEHGNNVAIIRNHTTSGVTPEVVQNTDALLTNQKNIFLSITVADCLPIYLYDPSNGVVGIIHAGWKGLVKNIIQKTITKAQNELQLDPLQTLISIGPSIGVCHFEVQEDVADQFKDYQVAISTRDGKLYLDLQLIAKTQLKQCEIKDANIEISSICTYENENYFSYRRDKTNPVKAQIAVIGLKEN